MNASWSIRAWPALLCQADGASQLHFEHFDTRIVSAANDESPYSGQTVWRGRSNDGVEAGVGWDWVMLSRDVVAMAEDMNKQLAASKAQPKPGETIAGHATQMYEVNAPEMTMKMWVDQKYGIPLRQVVTRKGEQPMTVLDVSELKFTAPPAGTFTFPANCKKLEGTTDATGGHVTSH